MRLSCDEIFTCGTTPFLSGAGAQVNGIGPSITTICDCSHGMGIRTKKELDFSENRPKLTIPPRPGPGSSGQSVSGIFPLPIPNARLLVFGPFSEAESCPYYRAAGTAGTGISPCARNHISSRFGHWSRAASLLPRPVPWGPLAKTCISAGTPALTSAS